MAAMIQYMMLEGGGGSVDETANSSLMILPYLVGLMMLSIAENSRRMFGRERCYLYGKTLGPYLTSRAPGSVVRWISSAQDVEAEV